MLSAAEELLQQVTAVMADYRQEALLWSEQFLEALDTLECSSFPLDEFSKRRNLLTDEYWCHVGRIGQSYSRQMVALYKAALQQDMNHEQWGVLLRQAKARLAASQ